MLLYGTIAVLIVLNIRTCDSKNDTIGSGKDLINYKDTAMFYKSKTGRLIAYNDALIMNRRDAMHYIDSLKSYLKDLQIKTPTTIVRTIIDVQIDSIPVPFEVKLPCDEFMLKKRIDSAWYKFDFTLTNTNLLLTNFEMPNKQETVIGTKNNGLFKRDEYIVAVTNTNPYMHVESIGALTFKPKPKFFDRWFVKVGIFAGGVFLGTKL